MAESIPTPTMDWNSDDRTQAFREFKQLASMWFKVKKIEPKDQHNYIILWSGREGLRMYNTWGLTEEELKRPSNVWDKFAQQIEPPENFRIHRLEFQMYKQREDETVDDFFTQCRIKAKKCRFRDEEMSDERIIEVITSGIKYHDVQKTLLSKDETLQLKTAYDICRTYEASVIHMAQFNTIGHPTSTVHAFKYRRQNETRNDKLQNCNYCGLSHPQTTRDKCPASGTKCLKCGKIGHWKSVCRSKQRQGMDAKSKPERGTRSRSNQRSRANGYRMGNRSQSRSRKMNQDTHIYEVGQGDMTSAFEMIHFETVRMIDSVKNGDTQNEVFATLNIKLKNRPGTHLLKTKVDSGAQGNLLPIRVFRRMFPEDLDDEGFPKPKSTKPSGTTLLAYNDTIIPQYGSITMSCQFGEGNWHEEEFFIAESQGPVILGLPSSRGMNIITVNCSIQKSNSVKSTTLPHIETKEELLKQFPDRFEGIGKFPGEFHITLEADADSVVQPPRKYPIQLKEELKTELDKMESLSVITKVQEPTDWVSAIAFSRKSNGRLRVCLDPKDLNKAIKRTFHKTPTLEEITHKFSGARVFSKLDAKHGYWSIVLDSESSYLTTFNTPFGRYRFLRLPFGLKVSQDIFQEKMDMILEQCPGTLGITDDIVVFGKNDDEHNRNLCNLMTVAQKYGLIFNIDKCDIKVSRIKFFGCYYDAEGVHPDPEKVAEIKSLPSPTGVNELQQFLGIIQYMAPFIPKLSDHTDSLRGLIKKNSDWMWTQSHEIAFQKIKSLICEECKLTFFNPREPSTIQVDASMKGLGAALLQNGRVVAFASKALTDVEKRYANIERELLAVVFGCTRFHTYIYGSHFKVESDHKPLENIQHKNLSNVPPRLQRMILHIQPYDFEIKYRPGREMVLADALSRMNPQPGPQIEMDTTIHAVQFSTERLSQMQISTDEDEELMKLKDIISKGWPEDAKKVPKAIRHYWSFRHELSVDDGLVMKGERIIIPEVMRNETLRKIHEGHQGISKCQLRAKTCVYWTGINKDIEQIVAQCSICQEYQKSQAHEPLIPHDIPQRQWQTVGTDLFQFNGEEHLIIADYYSKFFFVRKISGKCTSRAVISATKQVFGEQGIPNKVISDNGPHFDCMEYRQFAEKWGFDHVTSSPRYPRSNGFIERTIQTVKDSLKKAKRSGTDPDFALLCLRSTPLDGVIPSPAELLNSRKMRSNLPVNIRNSIPDKDRIYDRLSERQQIQKENHDKHCRKELPPLLVGQRVLTQDQRTGRWSPAVVTEICREPRSYLIQTENGYVYRRNRCHLKVIQPDVRRVRFADNQRREMNNGHDDSVLANTPQAHNSECDNIAQSDRANRPYEKQYQTQSGRSSIKPKRLIEN